MALTTHAYQINHQHPNISYSWLDVAVGGNCSTRACTCMRNGIKCSVACEHCKRSACMNATVIYADAYEEEVNESEDEM